MSETRDVTMRQLDLTLRAVRLRIEVCVQRWSPPIPDRRWDWMAVTSNYGGPPDPVGLGRTREDAIEDLIEMLEERQL